MSDYILQATWSTKDALATGEALKAISGTELGIEFDAIATAITSKYDSTDIASQAEAEAESSNSVLITPSRVGMWADANAGIVGDLHALADPAADVLLGWDDSANAAIGFTLGEGIASSGTAIRVLLSEFSTVAIAAADTIPFYDVSGAVNGKTTVTAFEAGLELANMVGWDANDNIDHTAVSVSTTAPLFGGGTIAATRTHTFDISGLTSMTAANIVGADIFLIDDGAGGTNKKIAWQDLGVPQTNDTTTTPLSTPTLAMANRWFNCNNVAAISAIIPANASVAYPVGTSFAFHQRGAGQITVSVTTDTLRAPLGAKTTNQYSTIFATKIAATEWTITGQAAA